jgi:hypothetical protein
LVEDILVLGARRLIFYLHLEEGCAIALGDILKAEDVAYLI